MSSLKTVDDLTKHILEYDSDTFSVFELKVTESEARSIALICVHNCIEAMLSSETLDGLMLSDALENLRD